MINNNYGRVNIMEILRNDNYKRIHRTHTAESTWKSSPNAGVPTHDQEVTTYKKIKRCCACAVLIIMLAFSHKNRVCYGANSKSRRF